MADFPGFTGWTLPYTNRRKLWPLRSVVPAQAGIQ